jgi:preprotein translocase subunit SecY
MNYKQLYKLLLISSLMLTIICLSYMIISIFTKIELFGFFIACFSFIICLLFLFQFIKQLKDLKKVEKETQTNIKDVYLYYQLLEPPEMNN